MKITRRHLRQIIREELIREADPDTDADDAAELRDIADDLETQSLDPVVDSWIKFVDRNSDIKDTLLSAWEKMTTGTSDPWEVASEVGEAIGLPWIEKGQFYLPDRGSKEEGLSSVRTGVLWHAKKMRPGKKYLNRGEIEQELERRKSDRDTARSAMKPAPLSKKPYGGGSRYRPWGRST